MQRKEVVVRLSKSVNNNNSIIHRKHVHIGGDGIIFVDSYLDALNISQLLSVALRERNQSEHTHAFSPKRAKKSAGLV